MRVIGVVGLPASGKGEFSKIATNMGIPVVVMGDVIRNAVTEVGMEPTDLNFGAMANKLRAERGMDAIAHLCIPKIERQNAPLVVVDGIRSEAEVRVFRKYFPDFILIGIYAPFGVRLARLGGRGRPDDTGHVEALKLRDDREMSWGLEKALRLADIRIGNEKELEEYTGKVRELLQRLGRDV